MLGPDFVLVKWGGGGEWSDGVVEWWSGGSEDPANQDSPAGVEKCARHRLIQRSGQPAP
jgi:hypothetical protein